MRYTYRGGDYQLELDYDGQINCKVLGITGATADEVKALIRKHVDVEKAVKAQPILTWGDRYQRQQYLRYYEGKAKPVNVGSSRWVEVWISWKEDAHNRRSKVGINQVYLDTPTNRTILDTIIDLNNQVKVLEAERDRLMETLETLKLTKKGDDE